jgi:hypothetical protein
MTTAMIVMMITTEYQDIYRILPNQSICLKSMAFWIRMRVIEQQRGEIYSEATHYLIEKIE